MKNYIKCIVAVFISVALTGCSMVTSPVGNGALFTNISAPVGVTNNVGSSKVGTGSCISVLGFVAVGDASIDSAAKSARITKIHHVDYDGFSVLGVYSSYTVKVYGE